MATKGVVCSYEEIIDLHTESDHVTCLGIHTPTGDTPRRMFKGFFDQYKKYKYLGCSMKLVPAARLPADPMHVSTEAGELIISPRDLMNPILFHGCHGDDLGTILNTLYGAEDVMDSVSAIDVESIGVADNIKTGFYEILERLYYRALTDNTWKKASVSRGFRKDNLHPLVYSLATNRQIMPGSQGVDPLDIQQNDYLAARQRDPSLDIDPVEGATGVFNYSMKNNLTFMTPRLTSLGWMDTRNVLTSLPDDFTINVDTRVADLQRPMAEMVNYAELPKLFMGCVLLPPAYLTEQYFRLIINHRFAFKNFRGISFTPMVQAVPAYADANDDLFDPEKFEGADFDGGSDSGDTPEPEPDPPTPIAPDYRSLTYASSSTHRNGTLYFDLRAANNGAALPVADGTLGSKTLLFPCLLMLNGKLYVSTGWSETDGLYYLPYANNRVDTNHVYELGANSEDDGYYNLSSLEGYDQDFFDYLANSYNDPSTYPIILQQRSS